MSARVVVVGTGLLAFALAGCAAKRCPDAQTPPAVEPATEPAAEPIVEPTVGPTVKDEPAQSGGITLPSLDGLNLTSVGPPDDGPPDAEKWLRKITVRIPTEGQSRVTDVHNASQWRGIALPRHESQRPIPRIEEPPEVRVRVAADGKVRLGRLEVASPRELGARLEELLARGPNLRLVFDAESAAPWGKVMAVAAVAADAKPNLLFQAPPGPLIGEGMGALKERLGAEAGRSIGRLNAIVPIEIGRDSQGLPNVCLRIRADAGAPYASIQQAMLAAMMNYIWRVSLVGLLDGREVEIGVGYDSPEDPPARPPVLDQRPTARRELFKREREIDMPDNIEDPIFADDEGDKADETPVHAEGEIDDIPLGDGANGVPPREVRPNIVAQSGAPGPYGYRTGGGRRRAAIRGGGSGRSESAVEAAHAWLARNQEPDGRWSAAKLGGAEGLDVAVTGLATLSLLGAGQTEKRVGGHRETVRKAVAWLVSNQADNGCLADEAAKRAGRLGTSHAIAGLALAEAFGMARVARTGVAAQKAVDYTISVHQRKYSGWGEEPKGAPSTLVTGWFLAQLKCAKVAGLKVEGRGFQGAIACLDRMLAFSDQDADAVGVVRARPGEEPSQMATPTATAVATFALQLMGWKRTDPIIIGGSDFVLKHLPEAGAGGLDHELLYWGTLVMFQMGGERWKTWNARVRDMIVSRQRTGTGDPALDGSWDPEGAAAGSLGRELGRAGVTALSAMCLEVYYRYLPLYR